MQTSSKSVAYRWNDLPLLTAIVSCLFAVSIIVLLYVGNIPSQVCCDAVSYGHLASAYQRDGMLFPHELAKIRTYLYPGFLALIQSPEQLSRVNTGVDDLRVGIWQIAIYFCAVLFLYRSVIHLGGLARISVAVGLFMNIYILVYLPLRLTESLSISIYIFTIAIALELSLSLRQINSKSLLLVVAGSLLAAASIMIRPANVTLAACWLLSGVLYLYLAHPEAPRSGYRVKGLGLVLGGGAFAVPLIPQWLINRTAFGSDTIFPVYGLGDKQLSWGVEFLKYGTIVADGKIMGMYYPNPFVDGASKYASSPLQFYVENPFQGAKTILSHVFNSINFDYLFPYVNDLDPWYMPISLAINHLVIFSAVVTSIYLINRRVQNKVHHIAKFGIQDLWWLFTVAIVATTCGLNAFVAVESRFGLPVIAIMGPLASYGILVLAKSSNWFRKVWLASSAAAYVVLAEIYSYWVLDFAISRINASNG